MSNGQNSLNKITVTESLSISTRVLCSRLLLIILKAIDVVLRGCLGSNQSSKKHRSVAVMILVFAWGPRVGSPVSREEELREEGRARRHGAPAAAAQFSVSFVVNSISTVSDNN